MKNENLTKARLRLGRTQEQVAKAVGIPVITYQTYERGTRTPSAPTGNSIARALKTTSENLFGFRKGV